MQNTILLQNNETDHAYCSGISANAKKYVTIKINVNTLTTDFLQGRREIAKKLATTNKAHRGYNHVRFMLDTFSIKSKHGEHLCIVYDVLREPIDECMSKMQNSLFNSDKLRKLLPSLLYGLDYMHAECGVVHTDLKPDNIMMGLGYDPNAILDRFVAHQVANPTPRKAPDPHDGHIVYKSSSDLLLVGDNDKGASITEEVLASAKITDIGLAEWGNQGLQHKAIQSNAFTCPEVLLDAGWSYSADIWNLGVMIWDLIETLGLFDHIDTRPGHYNGEQHLALMITLLGPPPKTLLDRGLKTSNFFDYDKETKEYKFKNAKLLSRYKSLISWEQSVTHMQGENKESFIDFAKKMIAWLPEERWTAKQLLEHPWLKHKPGSVICACQDFEEAHRTMSQSAERDAEVERLRQSAASITSAPNGVISSASSITSSSQLTDADDYLHNGSASLTITGLETPPQQGISHRTTDTSIMSLDNIKNSLPNITLTPSK